MKTTQKNQVVDYLLKQMTFMLLAKSPVKDALAKASEKHEAQLRATLTDEEFKPIGMMRNILVDMTHKLVNCNDVVTLEHYAAYIEALNKGEVLIAVPDNATGSIVGYESNR